MSEQASASFGEGHIVSVDAATLLRGCVRVEDEQGGWKRPWRFSAEQVRMMGSCQSWHPGLYRQMARCTAGIRLEFNTDSTELEFEVMLDAEPTGTRAVLDMIRRDEDEALDGIAATVDGRWLSCVMPEERQATIHLELDDPQQAPLPGLVMLPGFGEMRRVCIWLPALRGCAVRTVRGNGTTIEPVEQRKQLLVIGDSISQGYVTGDPSISWPVQLANRLDLDLVNQGLGGSVFQPGTLVGLASKVDPALIVVALGENYRFETCRPRPTARDIRSYFMEVTRLWGEIPTYVCTPLWHDERLSPSRRTSCWERVPSMIAANVAVHDQMALVNGLCLMDHDARLITADRVHPNTEGNEQIAKRLMICMGPIGGNDEQARRASAQAILKDAPRSAFPLTEALSRGLGQVRYAQDDCVLISLSHDFALVWAKDPERGASVATLFSDAKAFSISSPQTADVIERMLGPQERKPYHLAIYRRKSLLRVAAKKDVRVLDETYADIIMRRYSYPEYISPVHLHEALRRGDFLGGFDGPDLVGFVGEHPGGSIGYVEVFEPYRRQGWGRALEATKINQTLQRGQTPWCEVYPDNEASIALQRKLSLTITPAEEQLYLVLNR